MSREYTEVAHTDRHGVRTDREAFQVTVKKSNSAYSFSMWVMVWVPLWWLWMQHHWWLHGRDGRLPLVTWATTSSV